MYIHIYILLNPLLVVEVYECPINEHVVDNPQKDNMFFCFNTLYR